MSETSRIEWTDATWNPVTGCTKVSPGCDHCYAETFANRWRGVPEHPYTDGFAVRLHPDRVGLPLRWRRHRRIFVTSMGDLFHDQVPDEYIAAVFAVMALARQHTFQVLTKRHSRMRSLLTSTAFAHLVAQQGRAYVIGDQQDWLAVAAMLSGAPLPNVWLGVSAEDQHWADIRVPALLDTPAAVRFVSCEPLLGPIDLSAWLPIGFSDVGLWRPVPTGAAGTRALGWVIVGGESGPGAREVDEWWIGDLVEQCHAGDVPVFVKQLGTAWARAHGATGKAGDLTVWPEQLQVRQYPPCPTPHRSCGVTT